MSAERRRALITGGIVAVVVALIVLIGVAISTSGGGAEVVEPNGVTDDHGILHEPPKGAGDGDPVKVVVYEDFQCPVCQAFEAEVGPYLEQQVEAGAISVEYRPFSFLDEGGRGSTNRYSHRATNLALCALDSGGVEAYLEAHRYLFANQPPEGGPGPEDPVLIDAMNSADVAISGECVDTERFEGWVDEAAGAAQQAGVSGTPYVTIDGIELGQPTLAALTQAVMSAA